ncbi:hypothetical protein [Halonatronum saccharophilum]|uniref:hypothetical protein n=1 Tax=Halonatronum saccharophilum TaxID=150060 RepID=UPI0004866D88|nr:hypothetical protein [Halonatronum saccharophilum]
MKEMIKENRLYLASSGSALYDEGIIEFLDNLHFLTETDYSDQEFKARIYKIGHDKQGNRTSFMKVLDGKVNVRDELTYLSGEEEVSEKITGLRIYTREKYQAVESAQAGQLVGVMGLSKTKAGLGLGGEVQSLSYNSIPTLRSKVIFGSTTNVKEGSSSFKILNDEDPSLSVSWEEELQEIQVQIIGPIQLEVLKVKVIQ